MTDAQVQTFADERVRPHAEAARALNLSMSDDTAVISDVYTYLNGAGVGWLDKRTDAPHALVANDVLAYNTFATDVANFIKNHAQYPVMLKSCVRQVVG